MGASQGKASQVSKFKQQSNKLLSSESSYDSEIDNVDQLEIA
jgi:hypothetical protein